MNEIAKRLNAYINAHPFNTGDSDCETVLDQLYQAYAESHESDPPEIRDGFKELEEFLCTLPLEDNNVVFNLGSCLHLELVHSLASLGNVDLVVVLHNFYLLSLSLESPALSKESTFLSQPYFCRNRRKYDCFFSETRANIGSCIFLQKKDDNHTAVEYNKKKNPKGSVTMENTADKKQEKKKRQKALELIREMADSCAENMMDAGIPIRPDRIKLIRLGKMQNTRGVCFFTMEEDGEYSFKIAITQGFAEHMHKPEVVENVRNTIYHELLHTCPDSQSHNKNFLYWSGHCDKKLGSRTLRHMEKPFYFKTAETEPFIYVCSHCGNIYYSECERSGMICEICNCKMRLGQDH